MENVSESAKSFQFNHDSALKCYSNGPFKIKFIKIHYDPHLSTDLDKLGINRMGRAYILYTNR